MLPYYRLADAVKHGCIADIYDLIAEGAPLEKPDITSLPLLELAQKHGQLEAARILIAFGADPTSIVSGKGDTLIHKAIREGQRAFVQLWLDHGVDPQQRNNEGDAPIHLAARRGEQYVIDQLLAAGGAIAQEDAKGRTALFLAAESGNTHLAKHLIVNGADPLAAGASGLDAFHIAAQNQHAACCQAMLEAANLYPGEKDWLVERLSQITKTLGYNDANAWLAAESNSDERKSSKKALREPTDSKTIYRLG